MPRDWQELTELTQGQALIVERVRLAGSDVRIEGDFELPAVAKLSGPDQVFVAAFIRCHGSIKQMEGLFGVSYPTIKNRLNRIGQQLELVEITPPPAREDLLDRLERGEISVDQAVEGLKQ